MERIKLRAVPDQERLGGFTVVDADTGREVEGILRVTTVTDWSDGHGKTTVTLEFVYFCTSPPPPEPTLDGADLARTLDVHNRTRRGVL